jgi:AraC-like DNA-binding protein
MKRSAQQDDAALFRRASYGGEPLAFSPCLRLAHDYRLPMASRLYAKELLGDHALHYFVEGSGEYFLDGKAYAIASHSVALVRPGHAYRFVLKEGSQVRMFNLHFDLEEGSLAARPFPCPPEDAAGKASLPGSLPSFQSLLDYAAYEALFLRLHKAAGRQGAAARLLQKALLLELFALLFENARAEREGPLSGRGRQALEKLVDRINANPAETLSLAQMASFAGVSRALLCRLFKEGLGLSPQRFALLRKVDLAAAELLCSATPVKQIASRCGFADVHHFTRVFKKLRGLPPAEYRRKQPSVDE